MTFWAAILLGGAATYLMRALPLVIAPRWSAPPWARHYLDALPIAIIAALAGAAIAVPEGTLTGGAEVIAGALVFALARWRKNLLVAVVGGVVVVALLRAVGL